MDKKTILARHKKWMEQIIKNENISTYLSEEEIDTLFRYSGILGKINLLMKKCSFIKLIIEHYNKILFLLHEDMVNGRKNVLGVISLNFINLFIRKTRYKTCVNNSNIYISDRYLYPPKQVSFSEPFSRNLPTDCTINNFKAHKIILAKRSEFFMIKFTNWDSDEISLNFDDQVVKLALDLVYEQKQIVLYEATLQQIVDLFQLIHMYFPDLVDVVANELTRFKDKDYLPELLSIYNNDHLRKYMEFDIIF